MITSILCNLYISSSEESKTEFSPHLYASEKCKKTFPWNLLWQTNCLIAAMCLMWALDTKQTTTDAFASACQQLVSMTCLIPSACLLVAVSCVCRPHQSSPAGWSMKYLEFMAAFAHIQLGKHSNMLFDCVVIPGLFSSESNLMLRLPRDPGYY